MFLNHDTAFAIPSTPVATPVAPEHSACLNAHTLLETPDGWTSLDGLVAGDSVATLDGGFATITAISKPGHAAPLMHVPGGVLSNCSDLLLPADTHVALMPQAHVSQSPVVSVPLRALSGWRGIRPTLRAGHDLATLHFAQEEMIYAQTGLLIHARPDTGESFFPILGYGETRGLLARIEGKMPRPDLAAA